MSSLLIYAKSYRMTLLENVIAERCECPVALTHDDIQSNLSKVDRVEKVCQKEKQPLMEEVRAKARYLLTDMSLPGVNEIQSAQVALENDWHTLAETLESVKEKTQSSKRLIQGYL
uniref:Uncharacterized protein n=1 Tax=Parascaris equorum TaxID=6256 RepID=A0A914S5X8_PAREQ